MDSLGYGKDVRVKDILSDAAARGIVARYVPEVTNSPMFEHIGFVPFGALVERGSTASPDSDRLEKMWHELGLLEGSPRLPAEAPYIAPALDYEPAGVPRGSARIRPVGPAEQWGITELAIDGPSHGNPFTDVELSAEFTSEAGRSVAAGGFYDGDGTYRIRFQAPSAGSWSYVTTSTARSLDGLRGAFEVKPPGPGNHGPVEVADRFHFAYRDGTRFLPAGTTAYAWTHQGAALEEQTLATLARSPFRKLRMCVFPKSYLFNTNEPERYPFARDSNGDWDFTRFEVEFFRHLERRIGQLAGLGIEADLILFHPYDRWGFAEMPATADDRYVQYLVRRLGAHRSVWWSMANEYDLLPQKTTQDWERLAQVVRANDHAGHLTSIHNCHGFYDHARPWITHCSIQRVDVYRTAENTDEWRQAYGKPVVIDECGYEGDLDQGWGNISGRELVRRFWEGAVRGGYTGHGETYLNEREELWWSKGGALTGESPERIRFLLEVTAAAPGGVLDPLPSDWDVRWGGSEDYRIAYLGFGRPRYRDITTPPDSRWLVDVIDTWNMTITRQPGVFTGTFRIDLPAREFMAIRLIAVTDD
jgi:Domain of unknown function (DUF5605)/Domain of unknown function (DUF5060)/Protein of unknown function (DUF4038)